MPVSPGVESWSRHGGATAYEHELLLVKPGAVPVPLEIHWSLFDSPNYQTRLNLDVCWRQAVPFSLGERHASARRSSGMEGE
ncbi:MAG: hypothetical protein H6Q33_4780 [Deltaproteobacteria bacterium]|nr:hypothetical protein [Deltaproteobacteria bacterium]